jgi:hypothetical protein
MHRTANEKVVGGRILPYVPSLTLDCAHRHKGAEVLLSSPSSSYLEVTSLLKKSALSR